MSTYNPELLLDVGHFLNTGTERDASKPLTGGNSAYSFPILPSNSYDEVYPGIILGDYSMAKKKEKLKELGITHLINTCMGSKFNMIDTNANYFKDVGITFVGFPAIDIFTYKLSKHFEDAAEFMDQALAENGKIYIHCQQGVSRSATIVAAFLMLRRNMPLMKALQLLRAKREVFPNKGFLKQLCELNKKLYENAS